MIVSIISVTTAVITGNQQMQTQTINQSVKMLYEMLLRL